MRKVALAVLSSALAFSLPPEEGINLEAPPPPSSFRNIETNEVRTVEGVLATERMRMNEIMRDTLEFLNLVREQLGLSGWSSLEDVYEDAYDNPAQTAITFSLAREVRELKKYRLQLQKLVNDLTPEGGVAEYLVSLCVAEAKDAEGYESKVEACFGRSLQELWNSYVGSSCFDPAEKVLKEMGLPGSTAGAIIRLVGRIDYCIDGNRVKKKVTLSNPLEVFVNLKEAYRSSITDYVENLEGDPVVDSTYREVFGAGLYVDRESFSEDRVYLIIPPEVVKKLKRLKDTGDERSFEVLVDALSTHLAYAQLTGAYRFSDLMLSYGALLYPSFGKDFETRLRKLGEWLAFIKEDVKKTTGTENVKDIVARIDREEKRRVIERKRRLSKTLRKAYRIQSVRVVSSFGFKIARSRALAGGRITEIRKSGGTYTAIYSEGTFATSPYFSSVASGGCSSFFTDVLRSGGFSVNSSDLSSLMSLMCAFTSIFGGLLR